MSTAGRTVIDRPVPETAERERLTAIASFVTHLDDAGALDPEADPAHLAEALWALSGPQLHTQLTAGRACLRGQGLVVAGAAPRPEQ